jgi:ATP-dependent Zn protease
MTEDSFDFLKGNAYHEGGHAIVGWALDLCVREISIRDDRPGENTKIAGAERLSRIDQIAVHVAGYVAEDLFDRKLPAEASCADLLHVAALLKDIPGSRHYEWRASGEERTRYFLTKHESEVHKLAAWLIERRRVDATEFKRLMEGG